MSVTAAQIRDVARHSAAEVKLTGGRTLIIGCPEDVWAPPGGDLIAISGGAGVDLVDPDEVAGVRVAVPDPDVESLRLGEIPDWMRDRMRERPELFVRVARLDPENLARVLDQAE